MLDTKNEPGWSDMSGAAQPNEGSGSGSHLRVFEILDFQTVEPRNNTNPGDPEPIPHSPNRLTLATLIVTIPRFIKINTVELIATVGVQGLTGTSQLKFRIFRDGAQIFETQTGVESDPTSEVFYTETFQAIDTNLRFGTHRFELTVENATAGAEAAVVGPISFSALAIRRIGRTDSDESCD